MRPPADRAYREHQAELARELARIRRAAGVAPRPPRRARAVQNEPADAQGTSTRARRAPQSARSLDRP